MKVTTEEQMAIDFEDEAEWRGINVVFTDKAQATMRTLLSKDYPAYLAASMAVTSAIEEARIKAPNIVGNKFEHSEDQEPDYAGFNGFLDSITQTIRKAVPIMHSTLWPEGAQKINGLVKKFREVIVKSERKSDLGNKSDMMRLSLLASIALTHELAAAYLYEVYGKAKWSVEIMQNLVAAGLIKEDLMTPEFMETYFPGSQSRMTH